ncbi:olfactory receptor 13H1-like [Alligator sinensis]|uniref:Olfactory receptor n=1 Tax=Alligator sinensis TaxID=38654 RepID=A0A1U7R0A4_ALLSI|nr:olfactory receptor 13H1-like [Alligator sinensis]
MEGHNKTLVTEFILLGLSQHPWAQVPFFFFMLIVYMVTLVGNSLILVLIWLDPQLHTPMYFFLSNLSFLDICYSTSSAPQVLVNCFREKATISYKRCLVQSYISLYLGMTECLLLAVMAYDRFVAICIPLHYTIIMNGKVCMKLAAASWTITLIPVLIPVGTPQKCLCGHNVINHFTCELQVLLKLVCSDTSDSEIIMWISGPLLLVVPFVFIMATYARIGVAVLHIRSAQGRIKAFSTCSSHLAVVSIFYGTAMSIYLRPQTKSVWDQDKLISVFYGSVTPLLNPLIYSLRNKDVHGALKRTFAKAKSVYI